MNKLERLEADIELVCKALKSSGVTAEDSKGLYPDEPLELPKPPIRHCSCGSDVVGAWDDKVKRFRWFESTPGRGQFLIRRKPLPGWGTPWQASWWGPTGGDYSVHECGGRVVEPNWFGWVDPDGGWEAETYNGVA